MELLNKRLGEQGKKDTKWMSFYNNYINNGKMNPILLKQFLEVMMQNEDGSNFVYTGDYKDPSTYTICFQGDLAKSLYLNHYLL